MKGLLKLVSRLNFFRSNAYENPIETESPKTQLFSSAFVTYGIDTSMMTPWSVRAKEVNARPFSADEGVQRLQTVWLKDRNMSVLFEGGTERISSFFDFVQVSPQQELIKQDEYGNFMLVVLNGFVAVERVQTWGNRVRLAQTKVGDILGEMSLLDSGLRFSACTTVTDCEIAVLSAEALDRMLQEDPPLAAYLIALLARKLSLRLRVLSMHFNENNNKSS